MSRLVLFHEYRKLVATVFNHSSQAQQVKPEDLPELKDILEVRLDGFSDIPPAPKDFRIFWEMSEIERLNAGLMIWLEGTDWKMWFMPFEWRFEIEKHKEAKDTLFFPNGVPFGHAPWNPDTVNPMFGLIGLGPLTGNFLKYIIESPYVINACHAAGDIERYPDVRTFLNQLESNRSCVAHLDALHTYLLEHAVISSL